MSLARNMVDGFWTLNGETIVFNENGALTEGQHRMLAVIKADGDRPGIRVPMLVVRGAPLGCRYNLGKIRRLADQYAIDGGSNGASIMALARIIYEWDDRTGLPVQHLSVPPTYEQLATIVADDPSITGIAAVRNHVAETLYVRNTYYFSRWLMNRIPGAMEWFETMIEGSGLASGSPALLLRNYLLRNRQAKNVISRQHRTTGVIAPLVVTIKAWNAHITRRKIDGLRYAANDVFPIPYGLG